LGDKAALDAYLAPRHVIDVLRDSGLAAARKLGASGLLPALRQLQPRLYSISSSPAEARARVQATIAVVRYESLGADRSGVCSTFVAERVLGGANAAAPAAAPVFISKNPDFRLPKDPSTPIIMVGPGTGLAPFRAFIVDRLLAAGADPIAIGTTGDGQPQPQQFNGMGPMVLFFGCRRRDQDYLYGGDLERWAAAGAVELHTAFSREPGQPKRYVQQRLAEAGARVWELLEAGAHFYICGDASAMAPAVEEELLRVIAARVAGDDGDKQAAARAYFDKLVAAGRFERDVWFG
jgi:sulfite reductase (NADPH) flavoprotein alpha-component